MSVYEVYVYKIVDGTNISRAINGCGQSLDGNKGDGTIKDRITLIQ